MSLRTLVAPLTRRYRYRVVAGLLLVSVPLAVVLAVLLTQKASTSLTSTTSQSSEQLARSVTLHLEDFITERQANLVLVADQAAGRTQRPVGQTARRSSSTSRTNDYDLIEVTDLTGQVVSASRSKGSFNPSGEAWFRTAATGQTGR